MNIVIYSRGQEFNITIGFNSDGKPKEVFADTGKSPQTVQQVVADACILLSVALQHGILPEDIRRSLARFDDGSPYTVIGQICDMLVGMTIGEIVDENHND